MGVLASGGTCTGHMLFWEAGWSSLSSWLLEGQSPRIGLSFGGSLLLLKKTGLSALGGERLPKAGKKDH